MVTTLTYKIFDQTRLDLRCALRQFRRNPAFALIVTLSLACGIGANIAVFTAINALLLKSLPVPDARQLVQLDSVNLQHVNTLRGFSYPGFEILRDAGHPVLSGIFAYTSPDTSSSVYSALANSNVIFHGNAAVAKGMLASAGIYSTLGIQPAEGRLFVASDDRPEGSPVAVLSYNYWQSRFAADPAVIGQSITVDRVPLTIIGVTPRGFRGVELGYAPDFTVPLSMAGALKLESIENRSAWWLSVLARKRPGVTDRQVDVTLQNAFHTTVGDLIQSTPASMATDIRRMVSGLVLKVIPAEQGAASTTRDDLRRSLAYLMAMVILLLAIACVNISNLILARTAARQTEIRVRLTIGAGAARIFRQLLTEILLLAVIGGILALPFAWGFGPALLNIFSDDSITASLNLHPDLRVYLFALLAAVLCGILLGIVPVLQLAQANLRQAANEGRTNHRAQVPAALMVTQIALALLLAAGAGLLVRSFQNIRHVDPGFRPDSVLVFPVMHSTTGYTGAREKQFYDNLVAVFARLPGVRFASFARSAPGRSYIGTFVRIVGAPPRPRDQPITVNVVTPNYFKTVGIDLIRGRALNLDDSRTAPSVAIVNQAFIRRYFGNANPLGRNFTILGNDTSPISIVGVARDVKEHGLLSPVPLMLYLPYQDDDGGDTTFFIRAKGDPLKLVPAVRQALKRVNPLVPLVDITTLTAQLDESVSREHVLALLSSVMGLLSLTLVSTGLYGVVAYNVSREARPIGIRMALGATASTILWTIMCRALLLVSAGIGMGLVGVFLVGRYLKGLIFGLAPTDPWSIALSAVLLIVVTFIAAYLPARNASRVDPAITLRDQ